MRVVGRCFALRVRLQCMILYCHCGAPWPTSPRKARVTCTSAKGDPPPGPASPSPKGPPPSACLLPSHQSLPTSPINRVMLRHALTSSTSSRARSSCPAPCALIKQRSTVNRRPAAYAPAQEDHTGRCKCMLSLGACRVWVVAGSPQRCWPRWPRCAGEARSRCTPRPARDVPRGSANCCHACDTCSSLPWK
jgi:hypothetical protein